MALTRTFHGAAQYKQLKLLKREILLLRKDTKEPAGVDKQYITGVWHGAFSALLNLVNHAMKGLTCIDRVEE
jgi:hypothetical protein